MKYPSSTFTPMITTIAHNKIVLHFSRQRRLNFLLKVCVFLLYVSTTSAQANNDSTSVQLFQIIRAGNTARLKAMLEKGANANTIFNSYSALMMAALNGSTEEMKLLIAHGADVNFCNNDSLSALWLAVPDYNKTLLLIQHGANANQRSREGNNVLVKLAAIPGSTRLMQLLINKGCDVHRSGRANDMLYNAASTNDTAMLGLLIRYGVSVNDTSVLGDYPVNYATVFRSFNTLKMLVDNGADVNVSPKTGILPLIAGVTPLMWAAVSNDKPSFYYLLQHGADAKAKTPRGYTTLMFLGMSEDDDPAMTQALIDHGASPTAKAKDRLDALYFASLKGKTKSAALLGKYNNK